MAAMSCGGTSHRARPARNTLRREGTPAERRGARRGGGESYRAGWSDKRARGHGRRKVRREYSFPRREYRARTPGISRG